MTYRFPRHRVSRPVTPGAGPMDRLRRRVLPSVAAVALVGGLAACGAQAGSTRGPASASVAGSSADASASPNGSASGTLTLTDGRHAALRSFEGRPTMVWFVANGCASCAASIPAMAAHLSAFAHAGVRVLVLGIYGAFGQGTRAPAQLVSFGRAAAGHRFSDPTWTWGVASSALTSAFDPSGTPDEYFLLNRSGHVTYQGSVPVSTMGTLLTHLKEIRA